MTNGLCYVNISSMLTPSLKEIYKIKLTKKCLIFFFTKNNILNEFGKILLIEIAYAVESDMQLQNREISAYFLQQRAWLRLGRTAVLRCVRG